MTERILVTGGAGFAGHHFVEHLLKNTDWEIVVIDRLTYASNGLDRLRDIDAFDDKRVQVLTADITLPFPLGLRKEIGFPNYIVHMAAETHVDNSICDPRAFVMSNVVGTLEVLNFAKSASRLKQFVYFSTDEVFGPCPEDRMPYTEYARYDSRNPYAATKAGGEELAWAYANTYELPVLVTHTMNLFGERQHPEKFIPNTIKKVLAGEKVIIYASKDGKPGTRSYIHCRNMADALLYLLRLKQFTRHKINIVGEREVSNLDMAKFIAKTMNMPLDYELVDFHSSRPGHDLRYAMSGDELRWLGWTHPKTFEQSLSNTISWTLERPEWLNW